MGRPKALGSRRYGRAGEPSAGESVRASESLADPSSAAAALPLRRVDVPRDPRLPSYPPVGPPDGPPDGPTDRLHDLYRSLSALLGITSLFKSREQLEAENLALRYQVNVLRRSASRRLWLRNTERLLFVRLHRLWPVVLNSFVIVQPETVVPLVSTQLQGVLEIEVLGIFAINHGLPKNPSLIRQINLANALWGAPRS